MIRKTDKLVEATMLALQGKLELKETKSKKIENNIRADKIIKDYFQHKFDLETLHNKLERCFKSKKDAVDYLADNEARIKKDMKKTEGIDVNVDNTTTVSVEGNETIVDTEDATVIVSKKEDEFVPETSDDVSIEAPVVDAPVAPDEDIVELPADDTVMPEEVVDEPVDTELPMKESKKFESKDEGEIRALFFELLDKYKYNDDIEAELKIYLKNNKISQEEYNLIDKNWNKWLDEYEYNKYDESKKVESVEIEVSDDGKEVEVTTDNGEEVEVKDETPEGNEDGEIEDIETEIPADDEPSIDEMIEENKKVTEGARDIADHINNDEWFNNDKRKQTLRGMLADKIADVAESLGDDYSEWVSDMDFDDIINDILNSKEWEAFDEKLNEIIAAAVEDKVDWTRRDEPASRYYTGNPDLEESKKVEDTEYDLSAKGSGRKSFYGKAKVVRKDNGDEELYSYGTHVGGMRGGKPYSKGKFSTTTSSHQNAFFKQRDVDPKKVDVEEGKQADRNEEEIKAKKSHCINCENKQRSAKVQEMIARRQKKSEALNSLNKTVKRHRAVLKHKRVQKAKNDLGINEEIPKKEEPVPNTSTKIQEKFSSKSFNEALTKYYKNKILAVENVKLTKLSKTRTGLKLEANLLSKSGKLKKAICLEMKQIQTGKSFNKYELVETKGLIKETKENNKKITMTTFKNRNNIIECRYILSK